MTTTHDDLTLSLELNSDSYDSYGALLAQLTDTYDLDALAVDFRTPSSASDPLFTLTFRTRGSANDFAVRLGYDDLADLRAELA